MRQFRIYTASKLCHAEMWKQLRERASDLYFTARWPFFVGVIADAPSQARHFWQDDMADVARSDAVLVYAANAEEKLRGALVEAGAAIALGKQVIVVGTHSDYGTWQFHPLVQQKSTIEDALAHFRIMQYYLPESKCP